MADSYMKNSNRLLAILTCFLIVSASCRNPDISSGIPTCIYKQINDNGKNQAWFVGRVTEYQFQGKTVYAFEPDIRRIADGATTIQDSNCNTMCNVGGFAGPANNQCNGGNFFKDAVLKRTIWTKK